MLSLQIIQLTTREGFRARVEDVRRERKVEMKQAFFIVNQEHKEHFGRFKYQNIKHFIDTNRRADIRERRQERERKDEMKNRSQVYLYG